MTVQRITFEDRGQDCLWWEVQTETGRIVGAGLQGWLWANGKCSVDMDTIHVGQRPRYFSPAHDEDGAWLKYEIIAIAPAETGGGGLYD